MPRPAEASFAAVPDGAGAAVMDQDPARLNAECFCRGLDAWPERLHSIQEISQVVTEALIMAAGLFGPSVASGMLGLGVAFATVPFLGFFLHDLVHEVRPPSLFLNGITALNSGSAGRGRRDSDRRLHKH